MNMVVKKMPLCGAGKIFPVAKAIQAVSTKGQTLYFQFSMLIIEQSKYTKRL